MKPRRRTVSLSALLLLLTAAPAPLLAQRADYLTPAEVTLVRDTMEPQKRIKLFLDFAAERLGSLESELGSAGKHPESRSRELTEKFDHYIRAVDDVAGHLEMWLERGGVDLRKLRKQLPKASEDFLARLTVIQQGNAALLQTDLLYDLEDALEATQEMASLAEKIPDEVLPPSLASTEGVVKPKDAPPEPGKPTMRRKGEDSSGQKPKDKPPQQP